MTVCLEHLNEITEDLIAFGKLADAGVICDAIAEIERLRKANVEPDVGKLERVRHVKRGTEYEVLHECAEIQASPDSPLTDYEVCVVYRSLTDGRVWVRRKPEFRDGRFVPVTTANPIVGTAAGSTATAE